MALIVPKSQPPLSPETCSPSLTAGHTDLSRPVETTPTATTRRRWGARPIEASVDLAGVVDLAGASAIRRPILTCRVSLQADLYPELLDSTTAVSARNRSKKPPLRSRCPLAKPWRGENQICARFHCFSRFIRSSVGLHTTHGRRRRGGFRRRHATKNFSSAPPKYT